MRLKKDREEEQKQGKTQSFLQGCRKVLKRIWKFHWHLLTALLVICAILFVLRNTKENVANSKISRAASEAAAVHTANVNVVDLINFLEYSFGIDLAFQRQRVGEAREKLVLYEAHGDEVANKGISVYYPVQYDRRQLREYLDFCPVEKYKATTCLLLTRFFGLTASE